jgi:RNA polymerase sigma-70 factor (ECF subfamily)
MDELALISDARKGDLDSFNRLVLAYQDLLYHQAYRLIGESDAAEDATQNAFISAYKNLKSFRGGSFKAWLLRIVTNVCYDELRRKKRRPTTPLEPLNKEDERIESPQWLADPAESPEEFTERSELSRALQHCLDKLPMDFRTVIVLVDVQGLDYRDASEAIGKPLGTVKSRLARARLRMRDCLGGFGELLPPAYRLVGESE